MTDTLGTAIMCNHIHIVPYTLTVTDMKSLLLRIAASFKDRLIRTFRQTGTTVDTFVGDQ